MRTETVYGIHSVQALIKSAPQRICELVIAKDRHDQRIKKLIAAAQSYGIKPRFVDKHELNGLCDAAHQGVVALAQPGVQHDEKSLLQLLDTIADPFVLVLDGVTDPHNLGACMRSADAAGVHAVVIPKDNAAGLNDTARKVACGAAESVPLVVVTNLVRTLKSLQEKGLWVAGAAGEAEQELFDANLTGPRVIVMGAEGDGMRRLTRETCDELVKIPMFGTVSSLNVSVATGVVLFEVVRQRIKSGNSA